MSSPLRASTSGSSQPLPDWCPCDPDQDPHAELLGIFSHLAGVYFGVFPDSPNLSDTHEVRLATRFADSFNALLELQDCLGGEDAGHSLYCPENIDDMLTEAIPDRGMPDIHPDLPRIQSLRFDD